MTRPDAVGDAVMDLSFITQRYFSDFEDIAVINCGHCYVWAWMARVHLGTDAKLCSALQVNGGRGHAFVRVGRLYFDAERPRGVSSFAALPSVRDYVGRRRRTERDIKPDDFVFLWQGTENFRGRFSDQGLPRWPASVPKRKPRPREAVWARGRAG